MDPQASHHKLAISELRKTYGGVTKYFVEVAGDVTASASTMQSDRGRGPGDRVRLGWSIHDTVVLHGDGTAH